MPTLNPNPSDQIDISGNTFTLGATLPGTPTMGNVITNITGLNPGTSYYFSVVSFSNISGYSGWAGPIVVYILPEIRSAINGFAWSWPNSWVWSGNMYTRSNNNKNLVAFSQNFEIESIAPSTSTWARQNIQSIIGGITAPDGSTTASLVTSIPGGSDIYVALRQTQYELKPGTTYTFSYYLNVSEGTYGTFRFRDVTGTQINYDLQPSISVGPTGWQRCSYTLKTDTNQQALDFYVVSRDNLSGESLSGATFVIWGSQLEEGSTATSYVKTYGFREALGGSYGATMAIYQYNEDSWLNYGPTNGITYVWPLVNLYRQSYATLDEMYGWTQNSEIQRISSQLKKLPETKRAMQPTLFNREDWFRLTSDKISATGAASNEYFNDNYPFSKSNIANFWPSPWSDYGISAGTQFFGELLNIFGSTGVTLDYIFGDNESGFYTNFAITTITGGITGYLNDERYYQSWNGLSSWNSVMNLYGVCAQNIFGPAQYQSNDKVAYLVWNDIGTNYRNYSLNSMFGNPSIQKYPNITVSNYGNYISDNGPTYGAPDPFGHPNFVTSLIGNAASPILYGEITQIDPIVSPGNVFVNPADPSFLILAVVGASGATLGKGPWTSFIQAMQTLRSAKRGAPNTPITPWVASVKDSSIPQYNDSRVAPTIGFADVTAGYNYTLGYTLGGNGNSAYYYELIKHVCLHGVKALGYFNPASFAFRDSSGVLLNERDYFASGLTTYTNDIFLFNETLKEINDKIGGFTLTTADASRISWLAPYLASGAPGPNGITWWWRITTNPGNTTFVNGQTLSVANNNIVGTWVATSGPTLAGVNITYA